MASILDILRDLGGTLVQDRRKPLRRIGDIVEKGGKPVLAECESGVELHRLVVKEFADPVTIRGKRLRESGYPLVEAFAEAQASFLDIPGDLRSALVHGRGQTLGSIGEAVKDAGNPVFAEREGRADIHRLVVEEFANPIAAR